MKRCPKCGETKPSEAFYKNPAQSDGLSVYCRPCWRTYTSRKNVSPATLKKRRDYAQKYYRTNEQKLKAAAHQRAYQRRHPEKTRERTRRWVREHKDAVRTAKRRYNQKRRLSGAAKLHRQRADVQLRAAIQRLVYLARKLGVLVKQPCQRCGDLTSLAHHEDYSRPFEVTWLCTVCHALRHTELRALGITSVMERLLRKTPSS